MRTHRPSLLCELHAHSTWSDGALSVRELADLYGRAGFDVLCVTDHALRGDDPWLAVQGEGARYVHAGNHPGYLAEIEAEAERARALYGLLLLPGLELTYNHPDPREAAHALAVGLRTFVSPDPGIRIALEQARAAGAALVAAHPHGDDPDPVPLRTTRRFFHDWEELAPLVDRVELFNRDTVFGWVAGRRFPVVACGDFHRPEHLFSWKTLLTCDKDERAVIDFLTSPRRRTSCRSAPAPGRSRQPPEHSPAVHRTVTADRATITGPGRTTEVLMRKTTPNAGRRGVTRRGR